MIEHLAANVGYSTGFLKRIAGVPENAVCMLGHAAGKIGYVIGIPVSAAGIFVSSTEEMRHIITTREICVNLSGYAAGASV